MASGRRRLGVVLILDPLAAAEVDGLRRALGDSSLGRIVPHITLVPPVNVRPADLPLALEVLRSAAARQTAGLRLTLGPPASFLPDNPVLYLEVGGDLQRLRALRDELFRPPLKRPLSWPWVPHVTLADGIPEDHIASAVASLGSYARVSEIDRVVLLEEGPGRAWRPLADARLAPPAVVGTGGLPLTITHGQVPDPEGLAALGAEGRRHGECCSDQHLLPAIAVAGHRQNVLAGMAIAWVAATGAHAGVFVLPDFRRQGVGTHLLSRLESAAREAGWEFPSVIGLGPSGFYESRSGWIRGAENTG